ncbi:DUF992 domain-containing protein [Bartonella tamiae]|uniref:DUF992 domain-containing protein n=1 Tax=Bartonella tamiae Th239 TaxID=1094558 RepID=J1K228_9HYPH|nr:DUF992 domain-containing protein [Bartonella tamiae]EJF91145.1 hypothetical protein ME5_00477 [Bartonella tamiae Th239]EJF93190.1 hypothetical protein MEG_01404 [Bartonella tamiae Th307]
MTYFKKLMMSAALTMTTLLGFQGLANANGVVSGTLTCDSSGGMGAIVTSAKDFVCHFKPLNRKAPRESYMARLENYGVDLGVTGRTKMVWSVLATTNNKYAPGALGGTYRGVGSSVSFAAGVGSQLLGFGPVGGFTLQPLSIDVHEGVNLALGVSKLTLMPVYAEK